LTNLPDEYGDDEANKPFFQKLASLLKATNPKSNHLPSDRRGA
jgi:hypothetical protein